MKIEWKPALVPISVFYFLTFVSFGLIFPYFTLQLRTLGLTLEDASLIAGTSPLLSFVAAPLIGYLGDKIGYKVVLIVCLLLSLVFSGVLPYLPTTRALNPTASVQGFNSSLSPPWESVEWVGHYGPCSSSPPTLVMVECGGEEWSGEVPLEDSCSSPGVEGSCEESSTSTCTYDCYPNLHLNPTVEICRIEFSNGAGAKETGSHLLTFWIYFAMRGIFNIFLNASFNISDAAAATKAKKEGASYSSICFFGNLGGIITPNIIGPIVDHVNFNPTIIDCLSGEDVTNADYRLPFGIANATFLFMAAFVYFFVDVEVEKTETKLPFRQEFGWVVNARVILFLLLMFVFGLLPGAAGLYYFLYAVEELDTSMTLLGYMGTSSSVGSLLILPCVPFIIKKLGVVNSFVLGILIQTVDMIAVGFVTSKPPYILFLTYVMDGVGMNIMWVSIMQYMTSLAPASLAATAISLMSSVMWIAGKGAGSLLSGYLVSMFTMPQMFVMVGSGISATTVLYWVLYHLVLKRAEGGEQEEKEFEEEEEENIPNIAWSTRL